MIRHPQNRSKGATLKTGFASLKGDAGMVTIDTDGQHDPADIPRLVAPILRGEADMVNGSRYLNGNKKDTPLYHRVESRSVLDMASNLGSGLLVRQPERFPGRPKRSSASSKTAWPSRARCWPTGRCGPLHPRGGDRGALRCRRLLGESRGPWGSGAARYGATKAALLLHSSGDADGGGRHFLRTFKQVSDNPLYGCGSGL